MQSQLRDADPDEIRRMEISLLNEPYTQVAFNKSDRLNIDRQGQAVESSAFIDEDIESR